jgi:hypothetical protein
MHTWDRPRMSHFVHSECEPEFTDEYITEHFDELLAIFEDNYGKKHKTIHKGW